MKKPYEQGYYDGYQDCKKVYKNLLVEAEKENKEYKSHIKFLEYKINFLIEEERINRKYIDLGKATKTIMEESRKIKYDCQIRS